MMIFRIFSRLLSLKTVVILLITLLGAVLAEASEYQEFHRGARTLGMGGAFTAVADDRNAIYFNPAGLAQAPGFGLGLLNPYVDASKNSFNLYKDLKDVDNNDSAAMAEVLRKYMGENNHVKVATDFYTGFRVGPAGVMISAIGQGTLNVRVRNPVWPEAQVNVIADYGLLVGAGIEIPAVKGLKVGATLKGITRNSLDEIYTADQIANDNFNDTIKNDRKEGTSIGADLGVMYTTDVLKVSNLNLALVAQNIPKMDFGPALDAKTQYNVGVALSQKLMGLTFTEALDYYDITNNVGDDSSKDKKIHMGVEMALPMILSVRAGVNQGYYTAGATLDFKVIKFDIATYGEELGVVGGQKEDRRVVGQISMGWLW